MAANGYVVNTGVQITWDGVSQWIPRGTVIDTPASSGTNLAATIGAGNLTALTSTQTQAMNGQSLGPFLADTGGGGNEPSHYQNLGDQRERARATGEAGSCLQAALCRGRSVLPVLRADHLGPSAGGRFGGRVVVPRRCRRLRIRGGGHPMTTPVASGTLYASVADLRNVMSGTDSGTGTAAQLTDAQLELALYAASNRVSIFAGNTFDGSTPAANPPAILHDLTLDLAAFWSYRTYLKSKSIASDHPVYLAFQNAMQILTDVRDGLLLLDPAVAPGIGSETGTLINRIPRIFTGNDSNTRVSPVTGCLESDTPLGQWTPRGTDWGGSWYEG
jgi:hypothetical protein